MFVSAAQVSIDMSNSNTNVMEGSMFLICVKLETTDGTIIIGTDISVNFTVLSGGKAGMDNCL